MKNLEIKIAYASHFRGLDGFDFDLNKGYEAATPQDVDFILNLDIGVVGESWSEQFFVRVVTPNNRPRNNPRARFILLPYYSFIALKTELLKSLKTCERVTWDESLEALRERFRWQYDEGL